MSNPAGTQEIVQDGFADGSLEKISSELENMERWEKSLQFESKWLKLRTMVVEAEQYACKCRLMELKLAEKMAKFGSFDRRLPSHGFISESERIRWNSELEVKKSTRITAEARANLLRRDLKDLSEKIIEAGYQIPVGSMIQ